MPLIDYTRTKRPVFDIDLDADPYDRWKEVGRRNKAQLSRFLGEIQEVTRDGIVDWLGETSAWVPGFLRSAAKTLVGPLLECSGRVGGRLGTLMARSFGEDYQAEIRGLAHSSGLPESKLFLANLTYDLTIAGEWWMEQKRRVFGACSSFSVAVEGAPVLVRNMDWAFPASTGRMTVMTRFYKGRRSYVNVAPVSCVGVLSAMRAGAWAVTLNQAPQVGRPRFPQWPTMHRLRKACDASLSFPQLVRRIYEYQTLTPFFAHVVGTEPDQQVVIEGAAGGFRRRQAKLGKPLIQTNHFVHDAHRHHNGEEWQGRDCDICDRYAALQQRLRKRPKDFAEAFSIIRGRPVTHSDTMNQMAMRPADGKAIVRVRN